MANTGHPSPCQGFGGNHSLVGRRVLRIFWGGCVPHTAVVTQALVLMLASLEGVLLGGHPEKNT